MLQLNHPFKAEPEEGAGPPEHGSNSRRSLFYGSFRLFQRILAILLAWQKDFESLRLISTSQKTIRKCPLLKEAGSKRPQ